MSISLDYNSYTLCLTIQLANHNVECSQTLSPQDKHSNWLTFVTAQPADYHSSLV